MTNKQRLTILVTTLSLTFLGASAYIGILPYYSPAVSQTTTATSTNPTAGLPREGEIALNGTVISIDATRRSLQLRAASFALPNGKFGVMQTPKTKTVTVGPQTVIYNGNNHTTTLPPTALRAGIYISVIGDDLGTGKALPARIILLGIDSLAAPAS